MAMVTYDVSGMQSAVKQHMVNLGYGDSWLFNGKTFTLPNTTLWKQDATLQQAIADIQNAADSAGVRLERAVATDEKAWWGIPGQAR